MNIIEITKEVVKKAIMTEPLKQGRWVYLQEGENCSVCAVGATLRNLGVQNGRIGLLAQIVTRHKFSHLHSTVETELEAKNYLGALSIFFEDLNMRSDYINKLIKFVDDNFPDRFYLSRGISGMYETYIPQEGEIISEARHEV